MWENPCVVGGTVPDSITAFTASGEDLLLSTQEP